MSLCIENNIRSGENKNKSPFFELQQKLQISSLSILTTNCYNIVEFFKI